MKKLLLTLGGVATVAIPLATVVSCSSNDPKISLDVSYNEDTKELTLSGIILPDWNFKDGSFTEIMERESKRLEKYDPIFYRYGEYLNYNKEVKSLKLNWSFETSDNVSTESISFHNGNLNSHLTSSSTTSNSLIFQSWFPSTNISWYKELFLLSLSNESRILDLYNLIYLGVKPVDSQSLTEFIEENKPLFEQVLESTRFISDFLPSIIKEFKLQKETILPNTMSQADFDEIFKPSGIDLRLEISPNAEEVLKDSIKAIISFEDEDGNESTQDDIDDWIDELSKGIIN